MDLSQKLIQLGFSKNDSAVYIALLELGQCKASAIIKKTNMHRNAVYMALDELVEKRLAFKTSKGGVALFQLSDAKSLVRKVESQLATAQDVAEEVNKIREKSQHEIKLYEGIDGLKAVREEALRDLENEKDESQKELLTLGAGKKITQVYYDDFFKKNDHKRAKMDIPARMLFPQSTAQYAKEVGSAPLTHTKLLPESMKDPTVIDIWKDQVAIMLYDVDPFVISIKNQGLANSFRDYFETLWNQTVFVATGIENTRKLFMKKLEEMEEGEEVQFMWANYGDTTKPELEPFFNQYHKRRKEKNVKTRLLGFERNRAAHEENDFAAEEMKLIAEDVNSPLEIDIYPNSITIVNWEEGALAIDIQSKTIRDSMELYFDSLWNQQ